jgi:two-component system, NarL family, response regulator DegU
MRRIKVLIVSSNTFARSGIKQSLAEQNALQMLDIVECDLDQEETNVITQIADCLPDIVLLDQGHHTSLGLQLTKKITRSFRGIKVVIISSKNTEDDAELFQVIKSGAAAYLNAERCTSDLLIQTISRCADGEYPINDSVTNRPKLSWRVLREFQEFALNRKYVANAMESLTSKELQVLKLICEGNSNKQIGDILGTSEQTIKNQVSSILRKLNANDRAHAVFIAARDGWIPAKTDDNANERDSYSRPMTKIESLR